MRYAVCGTELQGIKWEMVGGAVEMFPRSSCLALQDIHMGTTHA